MITEEKNQIIAQTTANLTSRGDVKGLHAYRKILIDQLDEDFHKMINVMISAALPVAGICGVYISMSYMAAEEAKFYRELSLK